MTHSSTMRLIFRSALFLLIAVLFSLSVILAAARLLPTSGQIAYTTWNDRYHIILRDIGTGVRHIIFEESAEPCCLSVSPDGMHLAYLTSLNDGPPHIAVAGWGGRNPHDLIDDYVGGIRPIWSADSQWVTFRRPYTEPAVVATSLQTGELLNTALLPEQTLPPQWSPDGQNITIPLQNLIYVAPATCLEGKEKCPSDSFLQIPAQGLVGLPVWSPDNTMLVFSLYQNDQLDIYTIHANGENLHQLTNDAADDQLPSWSPDSRHIVFNTDRDGLWAVYVMEANGSNLRRLSQTPMSAFLYAAPWSPDGHAILFSTDRDPAGTNRTMAIYTVDLAGNQRKVVDGLFFAPSPVWWYR